MPNWINNPHANYVLAAYAVAAVALIGLTVTSWRAYRSHAKTWQKLSQQDNPK